MNALRRFLCLLPVVAMLSGHAEEVGVHRFANYNVRYVNASNGDTGEQLWANRREYVVRNITEYDFDIVGMDTEMVYQDVEEIPDDAGYFALIIAKDK